MRESYSITCVSPGCRFARLLVRTLLEAQELARGHVPGRRSLFENGRPAKTEQTVALPHPISSAISSVVQHASQRSNIRDWRRRR